MIGGGGQVSQHSVVSGSAHLHRLSLLFLKPGVGQRGDRGRGREGGRENTRGEPKLSTLTEKEGRSKKWEMGVCDCCLDHYCVCTPLDTDLLHPDPRSLLGSPDDHGFVHGGWEQTERLLQLSACRGRQRNEQTLKRNNFQYLLLDMQKQMEDQSKKWTSTFVSRRLPVESINPVLMPCQDRLEGHSKL